MELGKELRGTAAGELLGEAATRHYDLVREATQSGPVVSS